MIILSHHFRRTGVSKSAQKGGAGGGSRKRKKWAGRRRPSKKVFVFNGASRRQFQIFKKEKISGPAGW